MSQVCESRPHCCIPFVPFYGTKFSWEKYLFIFYETLLESGESIISVQIDEFARTYFFGRKFSVGLIHLYIAAFP